MTQERNNGPKTNACGDGTATNKTKVFIQSLPQRGKVARETV